MNESILDISKIIMDKEQIKSCIPHRPPFLLIDQIHDLVHWQRIVSSKLLTDQDPIFAGHFPGNPIYPGVYYVEAIAQTAAVLIFKGPVDSSSHSTDGYLGVLTSIQEAKFRKPCKPGDLVCYEVILEKSRGLFFWLKGKAFVNNELAAEASISVAFTK